MKYLFLVRSLALPVFLTGKLAIAQDIDIPELQGDIEIFAGVLEDALDLNQSSGLFGMSLGGVDATYLYRQGILIEVRSALANQRNRLNLLSLNSAMQSMQAGGNPFERMINRLNSPPVLVEQSNDEEAYGYYQDMMDRIAKIDYSLVISESIQQASESMRILRALGDLDEYSYENMLGELDSMRGRLQENNNQLNEIEEEMRAETRIQNNANIDSEVSNRLDELLQRFEPLREEAIAQAADLKEQADRAERSYVQIWNADVRAFEQGLYIAVCNYGAALATLPDGERISFILKGLGEDLQNSSRRTDKTHILTKNDVQECQSGQIDSSELEDRSVQYSY